ncbi:hypothetical protein ALQ47_05261 [Pseudomonas cichorii]|nr:hypothetical protein ALQ47_05261 [Pseudomonas cichorii]
MVGEAQFVAFQGSAQFLLEGDPFAGLGCQVAGVAFDPVAALGLGAVHRRIGVLDQCGDVGAVGGEQATADAGTHEELVLASLEGRGEAGQELAADGLCIAGLQQAGQQDDEFIAAQARYGVDVAQRLLEALCDAFEEQIAHRVPEAVVDVFEAIQVDKQHGTEAARLFAVLQGGVQAAFEQGAVGQAGEGVVMGLIVQTRLGVLEAGDVGKDGDEVGDESILVAHGADRQPAGVKLAILAAVADFSLPVSFGPQLMPHGRIECAVMLARGEQAGCLAQGFLLGVAGDFAEGPVDGVDALTRIGDQHAFGGALEDCGGQVQFLLHLLAFGNVPGQGHDAFFPADEQGVG